jgi:hypothetical protein
VETVAREEQDVGIEERKEGDMDLNFGSGSGGTGEDGEHLAVGLRDGQACGIVHADLAELAASKKVNAAVADVGYRCRASLHEHGGYGRAHAEALDRAFGLQPDFVAGGSGGGAEAFGDRGGIFGWGKDVPVERVDGNLSGDVAAAAPADTVADGVKTQGIVQQNTVLVFRAGAADVGDSV